MSLSKVCKRCFSVYSRVAERNNTWKLPEIKTIQHEPERKETRRNLKFASLNDGPSIPKNWRSIKNLPEWKRHKFALKEKFGEEGWNPRKKLSRETIDQIKVINAKYPELNTKVLAELFSMSPELMRRILKSSFKPSMEESEKILDRWKRRGERHLQYKLINHITEEFVEQKKETLQDTDNIELNSTEELRKIATKSLVGKK